MKRTYIGIDAGVSERDAETRWSKRSLRQTCLILRRGDNEARVSAITLKAYEQAHNDPAKQSQLFNDFYKVYFGDPGWLVVGAPITLTGVRSRVQDFIVHPGLELTPLAKTWVK